MDLRKMSKTTKRLVANANPLKSAANLLALVTKYVEEKIPGPLRDHLKALSPEDAKAFLRRPDTAKLFSDLIVDLHVVLSGYSESCVWERCPTALAFAAREIHRLAPATPLASCPYPLAKAASATPLAKDPRETVNILELLRPIRPLMDLEPEHLYDALLHDSHGCPPDGPNPIVPGLRDTYLAACERYVNHLERVLNIIYTKGTIDDFFEYKEAAFAVDMGARLMLINNSRVNREAAERTYVTQCRRLSVVVAIRAEHVAAVTTMIAAAAPSSNSSVCKAVLAISKAHFDVVHSCYPDPAGLDRAASDFFSKLVVTSLAERWGPLHRLDPGDILTTVDNMEGTRPNFYSPTYPILIALADEADKGDKASAAILTAVGPTTVDVEYLSSFPRGLEVITTYFKSDWARSTIAICRSRGTWGRYELDPSSFPPVDSASLNFLTTIMFPQAPLWALTRPAKSLGPSCAAGYPPHLTEPMPDAESHSPCIESDYPQRAQSTRFNLILNPCGTWERLPSYVPNAFRHAHHPKLDAKAQPPDTQEWRNIIQKLALIEPCFNFIVDPLGKVASFIETRRTSPPDAGQPALGPIPDIREPEAPLEAAWATALAPGKSAWQATPSSRAARPHTAPPSARLAPEPAPGPERPHTAPPSASLAQDPAPRPERQEWNSSFLALAMQVLKKKIADRTFTASHLVQTLEYFHANLAAVEAEPRRKASAASYKVHMEKFKSAMFQALRASCAGVANKARIAFAQATADILYNFDQRMLQYYTDVQMQNPSLKPGGGIYKELQTHINESFALGLNRMPMTDCWLKDFLHSKLHQDARAFNLMADAITAGGDVGARAAMVYAREAYGAFIVSSPIVTRGECPELLALDYENIHILGMALKHLAMCAIIYATASQCLAANVAVNLDNVRDALVALPRIFHFYGPGFYTKFVGDHTQKVLRTLETVMPKAVLQGFVARQLKHSSHYFTSMCALLARYFLENNHFPDELRFLGDMNLPYFNLLRRIRALNCDLHAELYCAAFARLMADMRAAPPAPNPPAAPGGPPCPFTFNIPKIPPRPTPQALVPNAEAAKRSILEYVASRPAPPPPSDITPTTEVVIAYVAAHIFNLDARLEGPPKFVVDTFASYSVRRALLSPTFAYQLIQACTRHYHCNRHTTARVIRFFAEDDVFEGDN